MPAFYEVDPDQAQCQQSAHDSLWIVPPVESLAPFEVAEESMSEEIRERLAPWMRQLSSLGFFHPIYHAIADSVLTAQTYLASLLHSNGQAWAMIHCSIPPGKDGSRDGCFMMFLSAMSDGRYLCTTNGRPGMIMPESVQLIYEVDASIADLWQRHKQELAQHLTVQPIFIGNDDELRAHLEEHHARLRDECLDRRFFRPITSGTLDDVPPVSAAPVSSADRAVLQEVYRLENKRTSWQAGLLIIIVSLLLFAAASRFMDMWQSLWMLIVVLLFHELGHYVAMRFFGYRNLQMFFIPFLGAAVSGRHFNIAGWKKAVVALAGPVPGILLGCVLGVVGLGISSDTLIGLALMMLIINGFNLLPILPLDGGWVVHTVLFARHPVLDVFFRIVAILGMIALCIVTSARFLWILPGLMLLGLPMAWRVALIAKRLRDHGTLSESPDSQSIPPRTARTILTELRASLPNSTPIQVLATYVMNVFEMLNARPPGIFASLALLAGQGGSFIAAIVLAIIFTIGQQGDFFRILEMAGNRPEYTYQQGTMKVHRGPAAPIAWTNARVTLAVTFDSTFSAEKMFEELAKDLPADASLCWFGQTVFLTFPTNDPAARARWEDRLHAEASNVVVERPDMAVAVRVSCIAPSKETADRLQAELEEYLDLTYCDRLIPPWSQAWAALPTADRDRFTKACRTLKRLQDLDMEIAENPQIQAMNTRFVELLKGGDDPMIQELGRKMRQAMKERRHHRIEGIRTSGDNTIDHAVLTDWERLLELDDRFSDSDENAGPFNEKDMDEAAHAKRIAAAAARTKAWEKDRIACVEQLEQRMGPLASADGQRKPGADHEAAFVGDVVREGLYLSISDIDFQHMAEGLPALAEWLYRNGCTDVRYDFEASFEPDNPP